ncbi:MAG: phosphomannose isomerase type II C-terminal cupin domain [Candidatus Paceibacterota bacterium]
MKDNLDIYEEKRPWGLFRRFTNNEISTVKIVTVMPNEELSLQSHKNRCEFWHVISGNGTVEIGEVKKNTVVGDEHEIKVGEKHRLSAGPDGIQVLEIAIGNFDESDIVHYEDKYGRV